MTAQCIALTVFTYHSFARLATADNSGEGENPYRDTGKLSIDSALHSTPSMGLEIIDAPTGSLEGVQSDIAYRGLSVRMMIVTGKAEKVRVHGITRRRDYDGEASRALPSVPLTTAASSVSRLRRKTRQTCWLADHAMSWSSINCCPACYSV